MTRFSGTCNTGQLLPLPLIYGDAGRRQVPCPAWRDACWKL